MLIFLLGALTASLLFSVEEGIKNKLQINNSKVARTNILAVSSYNNEGVIGKVSAEIEPGSGKTLVETNPFTDPNLQHSVRQARSAAERNLKKEIKGNIEYSFDIEANVIGGPSAGASMTLSTIAAAKNRTVKDNLAVTGTIKPNGEIGQVGSVYEKAIAAGNNGINLLLVPEGQANLIRYEEKIVEREVAPGLKYKTKDYILKRIDLRNITKTKFDMKTIEVSNIREVVKYSLKN